METSDRMFVSFAAKKQKNNNNNNKKLKNIKCHNRTGFYFI